MRIGALRTSILLGVIIATAHATAIAAENGASKNKKPTAAPPVVSREETGSISAGIADKLAFVRSEGESYDLWLWADGEQPRKIANNIGDGRFLIAGKPAALIIQVPVDESGPYRRFGLALKRIAPAGKDAPDIEYIDRPGKGLSDFNPVVSPDGSTLIFSRVRIDHYGTEEYDAGLWQCRLKAGPKKVERFWESPQRGLGVLHVPTVFSPDGRFLAVQRVPVAAGDIGDTLVIDTATRKVTRTYIGARVEMWFDDNERLIASRIDPATGRRIIYVVGRRSEDWKPLTPENVSDGEFAFSPDCSRLAVHARDEFGESLGLWVVDLKTGDRTLVTENASDPKWSSDGSLLFFSRRDDSTKWVPQVWAVAPGGGEPRKLIENADRFRLFEFGPARETDERAF